MSVITVIERGVLVGALTLMAVLPLAESVLRAAIGVGISGVASLTQHLALFVAMAGAALASRDGRLLCLTTLESVLDGRAALWAHLFNRSVAAAVAALLCLASATFVLSERAAGGVIAYGVPVWVGQVVLPAAFALITARLVLSAGHAWSVRLIVLVGGAAAILASLLFPLGDVALAVGIGVVLLAAVFGAPVFVVLGGAALLLFMNDGLPIASVAVDHYRLVVNSAIPMIPLFTVAGFFLAESDAPRRLLHVFDALFGGIRGGAVIVVVLACAFFTSFSGASGVTIIALGGVLMPVLANGGFSQRDSLGLLTGAGSIGGLLPPGLPLLLYAIVAKLPIEQMFLAGVLPALLVMSLFALWGTSRAPTRSTAIRGFCWRTAVSALWVARWELLVPVIAFAGLFGGFATPVEAAALTAVYAFVIETLIHRDLSLTRDVPRVLTECGVVIGGVLLILGVALGFTNYLVDAQIPEQTADWVTATISSPWVFLLAVNACLLIAGCLLDMFSAIAVLVPLLLPCGLAFGIDPLHLGIIFLVNLELGYLTPPVGMNLLFAAYRFGKPLPEVFLAALPVAGMLALGLAIVTCVPWLSTGLPAVWR